ncbi:MAG TPA: transposase DNA-binding-containing protein [Thermoguttaceae bacterium]|nr:transposase DNA-binding-containing protein [Thermoguttaceae bacterium]
MSAPWVIEEMETVDLKDKRLDNRLGEVLSQLAAHPTASIPAACGGYAETAAAYRLFDNKKVDFEKVLQPHIEATRQRIATQPVVIFAQDTTEIDLTRPEQQVEGAGPLDGGPRRGVFLHPLHAFTPDGTPLGTLHAAVWARSDEPPPLKSERSARRKHTPIEEKESQRWIDGWRGACEEARRAPKTRVVCVADSEADIYELLAEGQSEPEDVDWIIRACQNRALQPPDEKNAWFERSIPRRMTLPWSGSC